MPHFARGQHYLVFDSDVLFFSYPREILDWVQAKPDECWFNADVADGTLITPEEAKAELDVNLWARVNSGLCLLYKPAIDFDFTIRSFSTLFSAVPI